MQDIFLMISLLPLVILCLLDAFYLQQQRLLSSLFNHVRALDEDTIDFLHHSIALVLWATQPLLSYKY